VVFPNLFALWFSILFTWSFHACLLAHLMPSWIWQIFADVFVANSISQSVASDASQSPQSLRESSSSSSSFCKTMCCVLYSLLVFLWYWCQTFAAIFWRPSRCSVLHFLWFLSAGYGPFRLHSLSVLVFWFWSILCHLNSRRCCGCLRCEYPAEIDEDSCAGKISDFYYSVISRDWCSTMRIPGV
jgi:hypothetical protein